MELKEQANGSVVILQINSSAWTGQDLEPLHDRIKELAAEGRCQIVLDCSQITWFASPFLGVLTAAVMTLRRAGGDLRLANAAGALREALTVCRLAQVLQIADTLDGAVSGFQLDPPNI